MSKETLIEYAIRIKRIKDSDGNLLPENEQRWEFATQVFPTDLWDDKLKACFMPDSRHAVSRFSMESLEEWWNTFKKYLISEIEKYYDINTLGFYRLVIVEDYKIEKPIVLKTEIED